MGTWPDRRVLELLGIELPIIQAPMAGAMGAEMVVAVCEAGGLGSLPCAMLSEQKLRSEIAWIRQRTRRPLNLNFFCHRAPVPNAERDLVWRKKLKGYYQELGLDPEMPLADANRKPFDSAACALVEEFRPEVVSFHFGLPDSTLLDRVKAAGAKILSSATTVEEAVWLADRGCDAIIAQGAEAGGHRGMFLTEAVSSQMGTFALVPQVADAVRVPVIAAGGIADARGIVAAFALGASAVQLGTAYLFCPEAKVSAVHREGLRRGAETAITNVFSGRPARGIVNRLVRELGPMSDVAPAFPLAGSAVAPLRGKSEANGFDDFAQMWAGQAAGLGAAMPAGEMTGSLAAEALAELKKLSMGFTGK